MPAVMTLKARYDDLLARAGAAAVRSGRAPKDVVVVAATKYAEPEQIMDLVRLGHRDFGESRVQQMLQRSAILDEWMARREAMPTVVAERGGALTGGPIRWHLIGELQRNKARRIIDVVRLVHTIDSLRVAEELQTAALRREEPIEALLQINASGEPQKRGVSIPAALHVAEQIASMTYVELRGVMAMAPEVADPDQARPAFRRAREAFEEILESGIVGRRFNVLSMGMTNDFEAAVEEGSNMIRVGSALFDRPAEPLPEEPEEG